MKGKITNQTGSKVYQKVLFVILSCGAALCLAYFISKVAFDEMLDKVDKISTPNEKLRLVSRISRDILQIDQLQRAQILDKQNYSNLDKKSDLILESLDTLKSLYSANDIQSKRIDSIRILLNERDKLFSSYVRVRKNLVDNQAFSNQIKDISTLIQEAPKSDSTVVTTKEKITTRTLSPTVEKDERGFFAKLFGVKSKSEEDESTIPQTVQEELNVQTDTIKSARKENTEAKIDEAIQRLEVRQKQKSSMFLSHEAELTLAGNILVSNMFNILHEVENEAMKQMEMENIDARNVVNQSVQRISFILLSFFLVSVVLVYLILSDIRKSTAYRIALEEAKDEAEYHSAAKQRFLSNMSHELRTPLQSIIGYAEQLRLSDKENESINIIYQSSEHLLQIVNEVLDYNRIISGKFNFLQDQIDLKKLAEEVVTIMFPQAERKNIGLKLSTRIAGSGLVIGDPFRIKQILFNIVGNAIKFTDKGEVHLQVATTDYGDKTEIHFRVQDTGPGIPEADLNKIFNEFEQSTNANSGIHFGNGLGLTIVKTLVEAMDGTITIRSTIGKGSTFTINFSLATSIASPNGVLKQSQLESVTTFKNTVWLIDDDAFILDLCGNILTKHQIDHVSFKSPINALNSPYDDKLTHIFIDLRMPEINGKDLYRELRERYGDTVKIIAFTAQALPEEIKEILAIGFNDLLLKPFKEMDLLAKLGLSTGEDSVSKFNTKYLSSNKSTVHSRIELDDHIIKLFKNDTQNDLETLYKHLESKNYEGVALLIHRLAGRTGQIGEDRIAFKLRKMEIDIRNGDIPNVAEIDRIREDLQDFIHNLNIEV